MKTVVFLSALLLSGCIGISKSQWHLEQYLVVKSLPIELPSEPNEIEDAIYQLQQVGEDDRDIREALVMRLWKREFRILEAELVRRAELAKLDHLSLRRSLDKVLVHAGARHAYLPVQALQVALNGKPIWVIVVWWENHEGDRVNGFTHVRMFAFEQTTGNLIAFATCM